MTRSRPEMVWLARLCFAAVIGLQIIWHAILVPAPPVITLIATLPLALCLRTVLNDAPTGRFIGALLLLPWFVHGVTAFIVTDQKLLAAIETGLILAYFAAQRLEQVVIDNDSPSE